MPYLERTGFELPPRLSKLWRYMSLTKFIRMLHTRSLYFATANEFDDSFEGSLSRPALEQFTQLIPAPVRNRMSEIIPLSAGLVAVNCWHISELEDYMMWSRYATTQGGGGIAIQSTVDRLCDAFADCGKRINIGKVNYVDFDNHEFPEEQVRDIEYWFLHKRLQFQAERELRAMVHTNGGGLEVSCELPTLIESVYVTPNSPTFVTDVVRAVCDRFDLKVEIQTSSLSDLPPHLKVVM